MKLSGLKLSLASFILGLFAGGLIISTAAGYSYWTRPTAGEIPPTVATNENVSAVASNTSAPSGRVPADFASILKETDSYQQTKDLTAFAETLESGDMPDAIRRAQALHGTKSYDDPAVTLLVNRWVELDPPAVLAWLHAKENATWKTTVQLGRGDYMTTSNTLIPAAYKALAARDPEAVMDDIRQMPKGDKRDMAISAVFAKLAETDPAKAMEFASVTDKHPDSETDFDVFSNWGQRDPQAATQAVAQLPNGDARRAALSAIASGLAQKDPRAAVDWAMHLRGDDSPKEALQMVMGEWAFTDPQAAMAWAENLSSADEKKSARGLIIANWCQSDSAAAADFVKTMPAGVAHDEAVSRVVSHLASHDPHEGLELLDTMSPGAARDRSLQSLAVGWFQGDPASAASWLEKLPDNAEKTQLANNSAYAWAQGDLKSAAAFAATLPPASGDSRLINAVAEQMASNDPSEAFTWLSQLRDGGDKKCGDGCGHLAVG